MEWEEVFQAECIFIPKQAGDDVGHSDGVVRFVAEDRVLINDYATVDPGYGTSLRTLLEKKGLEVETLPMFEDKRRRPWQTSVLPWVTFTSPLPSESAM